MVALEQQVIAANGASIFYYKQPNTHSISISLYVKAGALYENENNGITHFLEHMHFRRLGGRTQKELYHKLESIGAEFGGSTYKEFVQFILTASPKYFSELAAFAADLLGPLEASQQDMVSEKRLVLSEIQEDGAKDDVDFVSNKHIWEGTNLRNPILGIAASIKSLTLEVLQKEKEKIFARENLFFYVTGCFSDEDIGLLKKEIERYDLSGRPDTRNNNIAQIPAGFMNRGAYTRISQRKNFMHDVKISFDFYLKQVSRLELSYLDSILSGGLCSLLRAELIEKRGLIYSFGSTIEQYSNIGVYYFAFTVHKSKLHETIKNFVSVLNAIKKGISDADMETTRVFKTDNQLLMLDDPENLNWTFAYENHVLQNSYTCVQEIAEAYSRITKQQLTETANKLFRPEYATLTSLGNKKGLSESKLQKALLKL